jgi:hypothetical protein
VERKSRSPSAGHPQKSAAPSAGSAITTKKAFFSASRESKMQIPFHYTSYMCVEVRPPREINKLSFRRTHSKCQSRVCFRTARIHFAFQIKDTNTGKAASYWRIVIPVGRGAFSASNSVSGGGVNLLADTQHDGLRLRCKST